MKLYSYWRSSSSWRVRIALDFKGIAYEIVPVNLLDDQQKTAAHTQRNALQQVPVLEHDGRQLQQSLAIIEYLEESHPTPPLLPKDAWSRAQTRALAEAVNAGIQPLQNLSVGRYVKQTYSADEKAFHAHFVSKGMRALEASVHTTAGKYCVGDAVTLADVCLVPQMYGARRFGLTLEDCPTLLRIEHALQALPAFQSSHPDRQPDAVKP